MNYTLIKSTLNNNILTLSLNRPEKLNAYSEAMAYELIDAVQKANQDDEVKCIVLTGEGDNFCAGADITAFNDISQNSITLDDAKKRWKHHAAELVLTFYNSLKPIISATQGAAVGIASTMLLPVDIRLAEPNTRFGFVFTRIGLVPEACSTWFLPKIIGMTKATEWMITGRYIPAEEALKANFITAIYPRDQLLEAAYEMAHNIISNTAPVSVALTRKMLWKMLESHSPEDANKMEHHYFVSRMLSPDAKEGFQAFLQKRKPNFTQKVSQDIPSTSE